MSKLEDYAILKKEANSYEPLGELLKKTKKQVSPYIKGRKQHNFTNKAMDKMINGDSGSVVDSVKRIHKATPNTRAGALSGFIDGMNWRPLPNLGALNGNKINLGTSWDMSKKSLTGVAKSAMGSMGVNINSIPGIQNIPYINNPVVDAAVTMSHAFPGASLGGMSYGAAKGALQDIKNEIKTYDMR